MRNNNERFKIVGEIDGKIITLKTINDELEAEEERTKFAKSMSSSWIVKIVKSLEVL